ncbi:MAG: 3'-5' exonuclease, partial [Gemmatimonadota bacterium]
DRLIKELILERLEADDPRAHLLLQRMSLTGWANQDGVIGHIRESIHDLRWHPELQTAQASASSADPTDKAGLEICDAILSLGQEAMSRWEAYLREANLRDFDSLILATRDLLTGEGTESVLRAIRARYRILIIDEFQDTDSAQRDIGFAIGRNVNSHGADGAAEVDSPRPQLFLVGDPKQSIYRFRGADISVWNEVEESFREAGGRILNLSKTFRSAPPIVKFVNRAARTAIETTGAALDESGLAGRIRYAELVPGVEPFDPAGVEWLEADGAKASDRRESEAHHIAAWIQQHVGELEVRDPDSDVPRKLEYRDCAVLYPTGTDVPHHVKSLMRSGIPYFVTGAVHLNDRQEIVDVLNALRVLQAPRDDLRVFGFLRSPFVGLRDETIARIRLLSKPAPLLIQARRSLDNEWPAAPDHTELHNIERAALRRGLDLLDDLVELKARLPLDELVEELLDRSGYRLHILLMDRPDEILANLQSLVYFAETHRDLDLSAFFEVWDRYSHQKAGIKQAPLYSKSDDVVTLSTIHTAKGLEWPVVFLVGIDKSLTRPSSNNLLSDPVLGPVFCLKKDDRGPLAEEIAEREQLQSSAENARLLYVATTRARDRLVIVGPHGGDKGYDQWLATGVEEEGDKELVKVRRRPAEITTPSVPSVPDLGWLDAYETTDPLPLINPIPLPPVRWIHSATELMLKAQDPEAWERRYRHGAQAPWEFAPESSNEEP